MIRIGLIGCGEHSEIGHALPLARYQAEYPTELELSAVCDIRADRAEYFCRKYGFLNSYADVDIMLQREKLDACIAVVPVEKIAVLGIKLLQRGIPCVVEKPLGANLTEVTALRDAARSSTMQSMVSVNRRFMPFLNQAINWAHSAGNLRYVRSTLTRHARTEPEFLWATAVHAIDALRYIAGNVKSAIIHQLPGEDASTAWYAIDILFENGVRGRLDVLPTAGMLEESYDLMGDDFRAIVTSPFGPSRGLRCYQGNQLVLSETGEGIPEDVIFGFYDEAAALITALSRNEGLHPRIEDVYPSVELCLSLAEQVKRVRPD